MGLSLESGGPNNLDRRCACYRKRFVVRADKMLTAFVELERAIHEFAVSLVL